MKFIGVKKMERFSRDKFICMIIIYIISALFGVLLMFTGWVGVIIGIFIIFGGLGYIIECYEEGKKNFWL